MLHCVQHDSRFLISKQISLPLALQPPPCYISALRPALSLMLLTITTTHQPATDLGYLLQK
jgi:hypothetical protein